MADPSSFIPRDEFSEKAVLGALLVNNRYLNSVIKTIQSRDFYSKSHQLIAAAIIHLVSNGRAADTVTVSEHLESQKKLSFCGGPEYIESLVDATPKNLNIEDYVQIIQEKSTLRRIISLSTQTIHETQEHHADTRQILTGLQEKLIRISEARIGSDFRPSAETVPETVERIRTFQEEGLKVGVESSFYDLDQKTGGFQKGDLIIIAARPSMGKTALALNFALNMSIHKNLRIAFFSIEMTYYQIISRLLSMRSNIDLKALITGYRRLSKKEWNSLELAASELKKTQFYIDDSPALSIIDLKTRARRLNDEKGLDILFVDYLQLIRTAGIKGSTIDSRSREVALISASLKEISKELDIPVVAMAQLNRAPEQRGGKNDSIPRYQLSDLKESGAIEQDADIIMFLHREEQVNEDTERTGEADLIISKHRNGPTGRIKLAFINKYTKFVNFEDSPHSIPTQP